MQITDAIKMLEHDHFRSTKKSVWADLGCGEGTFTLALASLLHEGSMIYAVDKNKTSVNNIPDHYKNCIVNKITGDFIAADFSFQNLDGILMANSLHYVRDKKTFIHKISGHLNDEGIFLIVEYDTNISNQWVPYPIQFSELRNIFSDAGFFLSEKLHERKSVYNNVIMYSALVQKQDAH